MSIASETTTRTIEQWLPLLIALLAVIVGPLVQLRIAKRQIRSTIVTASRREWLNRLRDEIASFVASAMSANADRHAGHLNPKELSLLLEGMRKHEVTIDLLLNPAERGHQELVSALRDVRLGVLAPGDPLPFGRLEALLGPVRDHSQSVLKGEWERIKKIE